MLARPGSAIKRNKAMAPKVQAKQQEELRLPDASHFMKKRDFVAALCLLECDRKYAHNTKLKTLMGIAYCAFHNGDYAYVRQIKSRLLSSFSVL